MGRGGVLAWLLLAVLILALGSSTSPAPCSSRVLPAGTPCVRDPVWIVLQTLVQLLGRRRTYTVLTFLVSCDAAADGGVMVRAAGDGGAYRGRGGERAAAGRSLLQRAASRPPSPVPNTPRATVAPGTPPRMA
ncbi:hypothetical protein ZWY2020_050286 [Hordeum vulgare]|nr:hypothetical protein ZWY2020_050286 [Hordeum vulgare]